ncbi:transglutaminase family protein [Alicyclobacillus mengziensis]|uniref:Transglutaminase family protein n=1 Tax=Alicyclobacillus mengziensis TaxID=2931921 RepID=A0A9X7Z840_9BACL|nr:transglutaminase family protein [Alicyclobacillus mengziensis]
MRTLDVRLQTRDLTAFLAASSIVDLEAPHIQKKLEEIRSVSKSDEQQAKIAFEFVRDEIGHSFDLDSDVITIAASEVLEVKEGICFAKAHLLAALLRGLGIPAGFCYQRVTRKGTVESGFALHGLNAVYLPSREAWFRLDPRGNREGVNSQFSLDHEQLAYKIQPDIGEIDYPYVFTDPLSEVMASMKNSVDCHELFTKRPDAIDAGSLVEFES